jgi:hypothetical protein
MDDIDPSLESEACVVWLHRPAGVGAVSRMSMITVVCLHGTT